MSRRDSALAKKVAGGGWKERLRSECFQRLRQERQRILWASRGDQGAVQGALAQLITDVSGSLEQAQGQQPSMPAPPSFGAAPLPATPGSSSVAPWAAAAEGAATPAGPPAPDPFQLEGEEYEELMRALEEALLADQLAEEAAYLDRLEQAEVAAAVEAYYGGRGPGGAGPMEESARQGQPPPAAEQPQGGGGEHGGEHGVLCPLCGGAYLVQHRGVILCPRQDLRLDVALESLSLEDLRQRLAAALHAHAQRGCAAQPSFAMQQQPDWGGGAMLCLGCTACGCLEVVL